MTFPDYEGYEQLSGFKTPGQLQSYRAMLLEKTKPQVEFIRKRVWAAASVRSHMRVLEIGSGNGRLIVGLAEAGILGHGAGIDLSESRTEFANRWLDDTGHDDKAVFVHGNVLERAGEGRGWDLAVCITGCFQYFYPASPIGPRHVLASMRGAKYALFELYRRPPMGRTWKKLPPGDPWAYILDEYKDVGDWVTHTKTFIGRAGDEDVRVENLAYYEMPAFLRHLERAGFNNVHWAKQNSQSMVVLVS